MPPHLAVPQGDVEERRRFRGDAGLLRGLEYGLHVQALQGGAPGQLLLVVAPVVEEPAPDHPQGRPDRLGALQAGVLPPIAGRLQHPPVVSGQFSHHLVD